jgi:DNA-binding response OmpR family regulator
MNKGKRIVPGNLNLPRIEVEMLTAKELKKYEIELYDKGLSESVGENIRKSKICIIDDKNEDLKSLHDGLKREGFTNVDKFKQSPSINDILTKHYDLIILDLNDVASEISSHDGLGVLKRLKEREPELPILVVTGQKIEPEDNPVLSQADLIRKKPILASDLAADAETILKILHDNYWTAITFLKGLNSVDIELKKEISFFKRICLHFRRKQLEEALLERDPDIIDKIVSVYKIIKNLNSATHIVLLVAKAIGA